jgi:hypothetical protein
MSSQRSSDDPVTVLETGDPGLLGVARSLLESAGIPNFAQGEALQDLFGVGRLVGFNPVTGPVRLQVSADDAEEARAVLMQLEADAREPDGGS